MMPVALEFGAPVPLSPILPITILGCTRFTHPQAGEHRTPVASLTLSIGPFLVSGATLAYLHRNGRATVSLPNGGRDRRMHIADPAVRHALHDAAEAAFLALGGTPPVIAETPLATAPHIVEPTE